jgi:hypothetical protein
VIDRGENPLNEEDISPIIIKENGAFPVAITMQESDLLADPVFFVCILQREVR